MTNWETCPAVESVPGMLNGASVFTGTRVPLSSLFGNLAEGANIEEYPVPLRGYLSGHVVDTVVDRGWSEPSNGELLDHADRVGYQVLTTTDQSIRYQQNLAARSWPS